jgi:hypothetical protein
MLATNEIIEKRMRTINQLAIDIAEINEEQLPSISKYHDMMYFVNEMLRAATGLTDLEAEMTYGSWE